MSIRYALIGCGRISPNHIQAAKNNNLEIAAICDILPEAMEQLAGQFGLDSVNRYTDYKAMLAAEKPQLVAIAAESGKHAAIALDCIAAGCNIIIEKPIALSMADARQIIAAGREKGVLVCVNQQNRFNKAVRYIREAMEAGRFGKLSHAAATIRWYRGKDYYDQAPWRGTWAQDGGCLMNQCIHTVDLLRWMMGDEVDEVMAYTDQVQHSYIQAEDIGMALVKFRNGTYGSFEGTTNIYPTDLEGTLCIFGEKGTVKAGGSAVNTIEEWLFADKADDPEYIKAECAVNYQNVYGIGHTPLYADMIDAIQTGRKPYVDGEAGLRALELVLAIYKSAYEHKPVKLPLESCATTDFEGRFD